MLAPAVDKDGEIFLYDIFAAGRWIGSRRTIKQCTEALSNAGWPSSVLATNYRIEHGSPSKIIFENS